VDFLEEKNQKTGRARQNHKQLCGQQVKRDSMPNGGGGIGLVLVIIIIVGGAVFLVPISPTITASFMIAMQGNQITLNVLGAPSYSRVSLFKGFSYGNGNLALITRPISGSLSLTIQIRYANPNQQPWPNPILSQSYTNEGLGTVLSSLRRFSLNVSVFVVVNFRRL
jgi:hypothetical protein